MSTRNNKKKNPPITYQRRSGRSLTSLGEATRSRIPTGLGSLIERPCPRKGCNELHGRHSRENRDPEGRSRHEPFIGGPAPPRRSRPVSRVATPDEPGRRTRSR